ncbi:aldose epimerase family protein [Cysteiniphilum halobium]|uniref:aldose epimerase family protein n=1 Tax=Cysteiniphilum halobium TaxID=2219059 RepID=UPI000E65D121|nr:aldose epimerase family protein [Cysteiniphilum halobium]
MKNNSSTTHIHSRCLDQTLGIYQINIDHPHIKLQLLNIGAVIQSLWVQDKHQAWQDIVLGFDHYQDYLKRNNPSLGAVHAVVTNRIADAQFILNDHIYRLSDNESANALHIGNLKNRVWQQSIISNEHAQGVAYHIKLEDGYGGLPGPMTITIEYLILSDGTLQVDYLTQTNENAVISNLTNHSYFNLNGNTHNKLDQHELTLYCDTYLETDDQLIPTGKTVKAHDALDFSQSKSLTDSLLQNNKRLRQNKGYDIFYILSKYDNKTLKYQLCAELTSKTTGIHMQLLTTYPGLQLYTANFLSNCKGKYDEIYQPYCGVCLETHDYPDAPNHPHFPSIVTPAHRLRKHSSRYIFSTVLTNT